ncbi:MAG: bacteriohopanetetrol glucosamine biosynthesis glycosyltransferase HpnI [Acidobacteriota bacterium]|nr:bacteriohopanetetrol glucosamine biosynthesis glycosyltransferase HpnI [Acidobacteriota bacterium]
MMHLPAAWLIALLGMAAFPLIYYALACVAAWSFQRTRPASEPSGFTPPVSILKPLHGVDFASYENYASFCHQHYPEYEILFAVNEPTDPAAAVVQRLISDFPQREIKLLIGAEYFGANRKVNSLARLAREARYEILALSDGDVRVTPQYLQNVVVPLENPAVGAVTSFYRGIAQKNLGAEFEAIGAASGFFPGVLMAVWTEGVKFALGASIATTKTWLQKIGGFEDIAPFLADDYEIGRRVAAAGGRVVLSREIVWTMYPAQTARSFWQHQLRWARTVRLCRPASYAVLLFTQGLPWAILAAIVAPRAWIALAYLAAYLVLRLTMAWVVGVSVVKDQVLRRRIWFVPLWDALHFLVWLASFTSNHIVWGKGEYVVDRGRMTPVVSGKTRALLDE